MKATGRTTPDGRTKEAKALNASLAERERLVAAIAKQEKELAGITTESRRDKELERLNKNY
ncbi:hypothetical protein IJD44_00645 [bacterium]|nr:hypothetical protein [bacterium]